MWDSFGVEEIELTSSHIIIFLNYKLFRLKQGAISTDSLVISFLPVANKPKEMSQTRKEKSVVLVFYSKNSNIKSSIPMTREKALEMKLKIMNYFKNAS